VDTLEELHAIEQIKRLKGRYFRCMDTKDWDGFQAVFAADAAMDTTQEAPDMEVVHGNEKIRRFVEGAVGPVVTVHHGHMPEIEITSPTTARGVWAMQDFLQMPEGSPLGMKSMTGYGHYTETYELVEGDWLIKTLVLTRLRRDVEMA
jgi:SnoaL-like domain